MKTKMAATFLVLMIALGAFGFAAAWWTDELVIEGYVTTGTFGWEWTLDFWEITDDDKDIITADIHIDDTTGDGHNNLFYIKADDVYPCTDIEIWADLHFWGTVPGHINDITAEATLNGAPLMDIPPWMDFYFKVLSSDIVEIPVGEYTLEEISEALICSQWHECDYIYVYIYIHWVEEGMTYLDGTPVPDGVDVPMDATLDFTITLSGVQYNYP
jgi:hypothetical protein